MPYVKTDCFAYNKDFNECDAFTELFCEKKECKFYKEHFMKKIINKEVKEYSKIKHNINK